MAQNITLMGASYTDVPSVVLPKTGGGTAQFDDTTDANATAADIAQNKTAWVNGEKVVGTASGGGGGVTPVSEGVEFIDYDGTILHTCTTGEALALTELPENPSHAGLVAQGWNWTLEDIQDYLTEYPDALITVGQLYTTDDGKTRIYIHLDEKRKSPMLGVCPNGTVDVDWGDGTTHDTLTGTSTTTLKWTSNHEYVQGGDYVIKLTVTGSMGLMGTTSYYSSLLHHARTNSGINRYYLNAINHIELGDNVPLMNTCSFYYCSSLISITMPRSIINLGSNCFRNCTTLKSFTMPPINTFIGSYMFGYCYSLKNVALSPYATASETNIFTECCNLENVALPITMTEIGSSAFNACRTLVKVTIPKAVTKINDYAFNECQLLKNIILPESIQTMGGNIFSYCMKLERITIPISITAIGGSLCYYCSSLLSIVIPEAVTTIYNAAFLQCNCLISITIPAQVNSIGKQAFSGCLSMKEYHFLPTAPPTLANTNALSNIPSDCIIYVPYSEDHSILNAYQTATNWSTYASYMQEEPQ